MYSRDRSESQQASQADSELLENILSHMEQAQLSNREHARPYTLTREYKLFDDESKAGDPGEKPSSEVIANVEFVPPDYKSFQIESTEGSDRGKTIVTHILENESETSGKKTGPAPLTRKNYDFEMLGEEIVNGQDCWVLLVKPHHDEKNMIKGKVWVDKESYLTQQIQGEMAKTPSWWLKKVELTIWYGNAAGMWMPTATYAVADVRFFGKHVLTSKSLKVETADQVAKTFPAMAPKRVSKGSGRLKALPPDLGTGVLVPMR
jgi:hypothetical protein